MMAKEGRDGTTEKWKPLFEQGLQRVRLRATYVDITASGFTSPEAIDPDEANILCSLALWLLTLILLMALHIGPLKNYKTEIAELLPGDLIGSAEINRFLLVIQSAPTASSGAV